MTTFFSRLAKTIQVLTSVYSALTIAWILTCFVSIAFYFDPGNHYDNGSNFGYAFELLSNHPWLMVIGVMLLIYSGFRGFDVSIRHLSGK